MKKCLNEVLKYGGPFSPRDLYPVRGFSNLVEVEYIHSCPPTPGHSPLSDGCDYVIGIGPPLTLTAL